MGNWFDEYFKKCMENLNEANYKGATGELYPISKKTASLGLASDEAVVQFCQQLGEVLILLALKVGVHDQNCQEMEKCRFLLMDTYRILRNSCAANPKVQDELGGDYGIRMMQSTGVIVEAVSLHFKGESMVQCLAVAIQFLTNMCYKSEKNQDLVWEFFQSKLKKWLEMAKGETNLDQERTVKILNLTCALIESCLPRQWQRQKQFLQNPESLDIMVAAIQAVGTFQFEFGKKTMAKLVQVPNLKDIVALLNFQERHLLWDSMKEVITEWRQNDEKSPDVPTIQSNLLFMADNLIRSRPAISMLVAPDATCQPVLHQHVKMLEVISQASCCKAFAPDLINLVIDRREEPKTVIMYAMDFLNEIHNKGHEGGNVLAPINDRRYVQDDHPTYLLRRDLVRLIANLAYQNKGMQDAVREAYGKTGILLLCRQVILDERNPYLGEWAKLAMTNLVRDNEDNAKFMMDLKPCSDVATPSTLLRDCGLIVEQQGNKVTVRSEGSTPSLSKMSEKMPSRP